MGQRGSHLNLRAAVGVAAILVAVLSASAGAQTGSPTSFSTAIYDPASFSAADGAPAFAHARQAGASYVLIQIYWSTVAAKRPAQPASPADPAYNWATIDRQVTGAIANGLTPVLAITSSPSWAQSDPTQPDYGPDPAQYGAFAQAAASRYGGGVLGLPRVRYWKSWNEPNAQAALRPQVSGGAPVSAGAYRNLLNDFAGGVKAVHGDNVVVAGGLTPFAQSAAAAFAIGPLPFMRALLCLSGGARPHRTCNQPARFDVWAANPYTFGGPFHRAAVAGDSSLGDLPAMHSLLLAADRLGQVRHTGHLGFWVTEFAWDSRPPSPAGVPQAVLTRWVAAALFQMWRSGVSLATWFLERDEAQPSRGPGHSPFVSGLYLRGPGGPDTDTPKPSLAAFRFPFVALRSGLGYEVWGKPPPGARGAVVVEQQRGTRWARVDRLVLRAGVFSARVRAAGRGPMRARVGRAVSPAFALTPVPDLPIEPFSG